MLAKTYIYAKHEMAEELDISIEHCGQRVFLRADGRDGITFRVILSPHDAIHLGGWLAAAAVQASKPVKEATQLMFAIESATLLLQGAI